ncbi:MAG: 2,4'-dihydroxyacetophenone dioxygenase family protein [Pseudomonadota bacterium]
MKLHRTSDMAITAIKPKYPVFIDPDTLPWTDWVIEGTYFKLLHVHEESGGFSMMLKVDAGNEAPVHGHVGAVEVYVVEGEFGYDDDRGSAGFYGYEPAGARHEPTSPKGTIMFAIAHGPLVGYNPDGSIAGVVDGRAMYELAKANDAHRHLHAAFDPS